MSTPSFSTFLPASLSLNLTYYLSIDLHNMSQSTFHMRLGQEWLKQTFHRPHRLVGVIVLLSCIAVERNSEADCDVNGNADRDRAWRLRIRKISLQNHWSI